MVQKRNLHLVVTACLRTIERDSSNYSHTNRYLVGRGADVNIRNAKGETPLHVASKGLRCPEYNMTVSEGFWSYQCLKLLLTLGVDPNIVDKYGYTCLNNASEEPEILRELLGAGASMKAGPRHPLFSAMNAKDLEAINVLLDFGADITEPDLGKTSKVHYRVKYQLRTPLLCAARADSLANNSEKAAQVTRLLLERGADWKVKLSAQETLVHYAFEHSEFGVVQTFLTFPNIDYNVRDQTGRTALHAACSWQECLSGYGYKHWYPKATLPAITLLDLGVDVDAIDEDGRTALHYLLGNDNFATDLTLLFLERAEVQLLLLRRDNNGFSPFHIALRHFRIKACDFLLTNGADLFDRDRHGRTSLHYLANGLDKDRDGDNIMRSVLQSMKLEEEPFEFPTACLNLWQRYLDAGGDINTKDNDGNPPLFIYLASPVKNRWGQATDDSCHLKAFPTLFSTADVFARNLEGETALHVVAKRQPMALPKPPEMGEEHDAKLFKFLMSKGLDPLSEDEKGRSALDVAAACGKTGIMELFRKGKK